MRAIKSQLSQACILLAAILRIISPVYNQVSSGSSYTLFHRLVQAPPSSSSTPSNTTEWHRRGLLEIVPDNASLQHFKIASFSKELGNPLVTPKETLISSAGKRWSYQIALGPLRAFTLPGESGTPESGVAFASFPLCDFVVEDRTPTRLEEHLNVWIRGSRKPRSQRAGHDSTKQEESPAHDLHHDLLGIQWTISAPSTSSTRSASDSCHDHHPARPSAPMSASGLPGPRRSTLLDAFLASLAHPQDQASTLKISLRIPERLSEPILNPHPIVQHAQLMADGTVKPAAPEKGFLAKYWMYILPVVVMLVVGGGPAPPEEGGAHATNQQ
ncbi:hypothetical protein PGTUg99_033749 [Puccinia graminis f. sp. tritici]|uniref:ER membrane protein complex subunit 10 n=1 Tax=Puccinia graminis f. sp. tritici TaxID=56615 RepID=A0A5B0RWU0_PUCGR|nr:hypothetical protein PGTUg99_033749 [Puccinia graminis f. sp. tritici]